MPELKEWITVKEAAVLVGRDVRQIYRWIGQGRLATRTSMGGVTEVPAKAILRVETEVKRGRPRGRPNGRYG